MPYAPPQKVAFSPQAARRARRIQLGRAGPRWQDDRHQLAPVSSDRDPTIIDEDFARLNAKPDAISREADWEQAQIPTRSFAVTASNLKRTRPPGRCISPLGRKEVRFHQEFLLKLISMRILLAMLLVAGVSPSEARVSQLKLPGQEGQTVAVHCIASRRPNGEAVLFIHGLSFPTQLAEGFEFDGRDSWLDFLANRRFLACGLDFLGFGESSRPPAMSAEPAGAAPLDRAADAAMQISVAADYLLKNPNVKRLHLVAHSWGTVPAALYAAGHAKTLSSLTFFAPVVPKPGTPVKSTDFSWWEISPRERYEQLKFRDVLPTGLHLLEPAVDRKWAETFAASGPGHQSKGIDASVRIPAGPLADFNDAVTDHYPYNPMDVRIPIFVVYGSYDNVIDDAGAETFLSRFGNSPFKWRLRIDDGTHVMHLERNRQSLYQSVLAFIATVDHKSE
jgi:pimeloyl-ACP methyl ester carboxylesterase